MVKGVAGLGMLDPTPIIGDVSTKACSRDSTWVNSSSATITPGAMETAHTLW